jgi:hypothetical protein
METRAFNFRDRRTPNQIRHRLERDIRAILRIDTAGGRLTFQGTLKSDYGMFGFHLAVEAANRSNNLYSIRIEATPLPGSPDDERFRRSAQSWMDVWTHGFERSNDMVEDSPDLHRRFVEEALEAEADEATVADVQRLILDAMRKGAKFSTVHKEGGSTVSKWGPFFVRVDHGESSGIGMLPTKASFLKFIRNHYDFGLPELDSWKLILRMMDSP